MMVLVVKRSAWLRWVVHHHGSVGHDGGHHHGGDVDAGAVVSDGDGGRNHDVLLLC